ncbi:MAG: DNA repair protein RecO [Calditrichaeota bacterium]|nr:DNA repair protein RecO [Calditrichota bacterium]
MTQNLKTEALVIYTMRWSESSRIVHLFTPEKGIIKVIARGALRPKSSYRGILENLNHIEAVISIKESRGLQMLSQADLLNPFTKIRDDLEATAVAFAIIEILTRIIQGNENSKDIFRISIDLFEALNQSKTTHYVSYLLYFLLHASEYLGYGWNLSECKNCGKIPESFPLKADIENGAVYCKNCKRIISTTHFNISRDQWNILIRMQNMSSSGLSRFPEETEGDMQFSSLIDLLLAHLNYHTDQNLQLKSLKMFLT